MRLSFGLGYGLIVEQRQQGGGFGGIYHYTGAFAHKAGIYLGGGQFYIPLDDGLVAGALFHGHGFDDHGFAVGQFIGQIHSDILRLYYWRFCFVYQLHRQGKFHGGRVLIISNYLPVGAIALHLHIFVLRGQAVGGGAIYGLAAGGINGNCITATVCFFDNVNSSGDAYGCG